MHSATAANTASARRGSALRRTVVLTIVAGVLASPAVVAEQESRRRQIPVRMVGPGDSVSRSQAAPGRNLPARMVRRGEIGPVVLPAASPAPLSAASSPSRDGSDGIGAVLESAAAIGPVLTPADDRRLLEREAPTLMSPPSAVFGIAPRADDGAVSGSAAELPIDGKRAAATWTDTPPALDGRVDEAAWALADVVSDFVQKEPVAGATPTKRTEVRVLYDDEALYFGWINFDDEPDKIVATELRRDSFMIGEDWVAVYLDTFHDHRNAFGFEVNPLGTKLDITVRDESQVNFNWDESWESAASITERGWEAEFSIPFAALRYPTGSNIWGIEFEREVVRTKERLNWNNTSRDYDWRAVSQFGNLVGLQNLGLTDRFRLKPFVTGGYASFQQRADPISDTSGDLGLEVFRVKLTPNLTADLTLNTDFAQVEADTQQVNLTRFSLFFPEQREFFLEAANNFTFGTLARRSAGDSEGGGFQRQPPLALLFFSRRVGLGPGGQPVPIRFGGKLTGKLGSGNVGFVNVQTGDSQFGAGQDFAALRWKQDVLERSSIGALLTNVQGPDGQYNRVFGVDADFTFFDHLLLSGFVAGGRDNDIEGTSWVGQLSAGWESDGWGLGGDVTYVADDFDTDLGFVLRQDIVRYNYQGRWSLRPSWPFLRRVSLEPSFERITDTSGRLVSRLSRLGARLDLESGDFFRFRINRSYELLDFNFPIDESVTIPIGDYSWTDGEITLRGAFRRAISGALTFNLGEFYDGTRFGVGGGPIFRFSDRFTLNPQYNFNRIHLPGGRFNTHLTRLRTNLSFSERLLFDSLLQHSSVTDQLSAFLRLRYIYRTGDDFYLVYRQSTAFSGLFDRLDDRTLTAKFTFTMQR